MKNELNDLEKSLLEGMEETLAYAKGQNSNITVKRVHREKFAPVPLLYGKEVAKLREELQLSQPALADFLDVDVSTVRRWEQKNQIVKGSSARLLQILSLEKEKALKLLTVVSA